MQDLMYDKLRGLADSIDAESIDKLFKEPATPDWDDDEEELREHYRSQLEPKYVIVKHGARYEFRARYVDMHRTLLSSDEIRYGLCDGGGFWGVDGENNRVTLYDSSSDFGYPKHIEEAIKQDGNHLLEILGRVGDKHGNEFDLTGFTITYMDRQHERHVVEPPYDKQPEPGSDIRENGAGETYERLSRLAHEDYERFGRCTNYTPPTMSKEAKKKKKAKRRAQKQARRKR